MLDASVAPLLSVLCQNNICFVCLVLPVLASPSSMLALDVENLTFCQRGRCSCCKVCEKHGNCQRRCALSGANDHRSHRPQLAGIFPAKE